MTPEQKAHLADLQLIGAALSTAGDKLAEMDRIEESVAVMKIVFPVLSEIAELTGDKSWQKAREEGEDILRRHGVA